VGSGSGSGAGSGSGEGVGVGSSESEHALRKTSRIAIEIWVMKDAIFDHQFYNNYEWKLAK
jgi:hypothetical protein